MSTYTDGAPPSVDPEQENGATDPDHGARDGAAVDTGSLWLREEIQRRIAAKNADSGGRHARRGPAAGANGTIVGDRTDTTGYVPRHSTAPPGPSAATPSRVGAPLRPPPGPARPDQNPVESATDAMPAWSGPPGSGSPSEPPQASSRPETPPPGAPRPDTGVGVPSLPAVRGPAVNVPPLPAPPSGPAAARLLAPPPQVGPPPIRVGPAPPPLLPVRPIGRSRHGFPTDAAHLSGAAPAASPVRDGGPSTGRAAAPTDSRPGRDAAPARRGPGEQAPSDEVLWSSSALPSAAGAPAARPAVAVPEQRTSGEQAADPLRGVRPPGAAETDTSTTKRVRVVLAERKGVARPVRTVVDVQEGTPVGELLRSNLIGSQLVVALRFALGAGLTLGVLPVLFAIVPEIGRVEILGLRLPWLILGVLVYPFLLGLGWWHTRIAERVEQDFADHVQD